MKCQHTSPHLESVNFTDHLTLPPVDAQFASPSRLIRSPCPPIPLTASAKRQHLFAQSTALCAHKISPCSANSLILRKFLISVSGVVGFVLQKTYKPRTEETKIAVRLRAVDTQWRANARAVARLRLSVSPGRDETRPAPIGEVNCAGLTGRHRFASRESP